MSECKRGVASLCRIANAIDPSPNTNLAAVPIELDVGGALLMPFHRRVAESRRSYNPGDDA
ncbi:hypothetical protein DU475_18115 [Rhodopseudomonas sp. WA056]|nr:hypothetical protein [Rhodopseudomonas sp. WA056]